MFINIEEPETWPYGIILVSKRIHPLFDKIGITSDFMLVPVFERE
jgi:hypothetical protein